MYSGQLEKNSVFSESDLSVLWQVSSSCLALGYRSR